MAGDDSEQVTRALARYVLTASAATLPDDVLAQAERAFVNFVGCVAGGCQESPVVVAGAALAPFAGAEQATILGHRRRTDLLTAAYLNCLSSGVHTYDDTHLKTIAHPTGPVASALFAVAESRRVSGPDFIVALALGIEVACRLANALFQSPARCHVGFSMTGLTGGIGAAAACARLLNLNESQIVSALGIAAIQASGFRETHQSAAAYLLCAQAARSGLLAAVMAAQGLDCTPTSLEGRNGFLSVFGSPPNPSAVCDGLGVQFEIRDLAYKPYPCGIVIHPSIDVCIEAATCLGDRVGDLRQVELIVPPLTMTLAKQPEPTSAFEAQVSLHHWAAAALLRRAAGLNEGRAACVTSPDVMALRKRIFVTADPSLRDDEAKGRIVLVDGSQFTVHVEHGRGSAARPLSDAEVDTKARDQIAALLPPEGAERLLAAARRIRSAENVGELAARFG